MPTKENHMRRINTNTNGPVWAIEALEIQADIDIVDIDADAVDIDPEWVMFMDDLRGSTADEGGEL
jgi:hypothetical protein